MHGKWTMTDLDQEDSAHPSPWAPADSLIACNLQLWLLLGQCTLIQFTLLPQANTISPSHSAPAVTP